MLSPLLPFLFTFSAPSISAKEVYTTNSVCRQSYCIDPVFPGLAAIAGLEKKTYECQKNTQVSRKLLNFCYGQVNYEFALPKPEEDDQLGYGSGVSGSGPSGSMTSMDIAKAVEQEAITYYSYHLSGMGYEFWENLEPWKNADDPCIQSVWKLTCFTFFPKCNEKEEGKYLRPCKSSCQGYLRQCGVECCDESVSCVFKHKVTKVDGTHEESTAYVDHMGPSTFCTGDAVHTFSFSRLFLVILLAICPLKM